MFVCVLAKKFYAQLEPHEAESAFACLLDALESLSPTVEVPEMGLALVDLGVVDDVAAVKKELRGFLVYQLNDRLRQSASLGVANARFAAQMAAEVTAPGQLTWISPSKEQEFLHAQPMNVLPTSQENRRRLHLLGVHTLGDVAALSENDVVNLFGKEGSFLSALVRGKDSALFSARAIEEVLSEEEEFDFPTDGGPSVIHAVELALQRLCDQLQQKHRLATRVCLALRVLEHGTVTIHVSFSTPLDQVDRIVRPLRERLASLQLPGPLVGIQVSLKGYVDAYARQLEFTAWKPETEKKQRVLRMLERLQARSKDSVLMHVVWDDPQSRLPERHAHLQDLSCATRRRGLYIPKPIQVVVTIQGTPRLVRTKSCWRPVEFVVEAWEVDDDWWTPRPVMRHYYRVYLSNGGILRLFHDRQKGGWYHQTA